MDGWFGFGFKASRMSDEPYTLIVESSTEHKVTEWKLGTHGRGVRPTRARGYDMVWRGAVRRATCVSSVSASCALRRRALRHPWMPPATLTFSFLFLFLFVVLSV